ASSGACAFSLQRYAARRDLHSFPTRRSSDLGREAKTVSLPDDIDGRLAGVLEKRGISSLYTHQRTAYEKVRSGKSIVAVTPTASSEEHTSELQSREKLVCRLLLETKNCAPHR